MTTARDSKPDYQFIDCARGYAILLVILTHVSGTYENLPYPVARVVQMGWFGVQMFFVASAITLMMSWTHQRKRGGATLRDFFLRRFFRIAPMYYAAIPLYLLVLPPARTGLGQLIASMAFINSWHPATMPTLPGRWIVVPGGWSIGVEFSFYLLFPFLAMAITTLRRSIVALAASVAIALAANLAMAQALSPMVAPGPLDQFLYYWLPNQLPVFATGFAAFHLWRTMQAGRLRALQGWLARRSTLVTAASFALVLSLSFLPLGKWAGDGRVPGVIVASAAFAAGILAMSQAPRSPFVNAAVGAIGRWSFSAYILHFMVIHLLFTYAPAVAMPDAAGYAAVGAFALNFAIVTLVTMGIAAMTYEAIERPFVKIGARVGKRLLPRPA